MAKITGNDGDMTISTDVVAHMLSWTLDKGVEIVDSSTVSDASDTHLVGSKNWSASVELYWDVSDTAQAVIIEEGATVEPHMRPAGAGTGNIDYNGSGTVTSVNIGLARNSIVTASMTITGNGALTTSTLV